MTNIELANAIACISEENTNPFYDPDKAYNGGGYYQPQITVEFCDDTKLDLFDSSCGDFGSRVEVTLRHCGVEYGAYYGTMLDEDEWYSNIPIALCGYIAAAQDALGGYYGIPLKEPLDVE